MVSIASEARREIEKLASDPDAMIKRCVWRFIGLKYETNEINGESVEFTVEPDQILQLFADLQRIDMEEMQQNKAAPSTDGAA